MKTDENFSPQQSLQLSESMINKAKDRFSEDGHLYLFWGWLVFAASIAQFILYHYFNYPYHYWVWMLSVAATFLLYDYQMLMLSVAMVVAWIIPGYLLRSKYKSLIN